MADQQVAQAMAFFRRQDDNVFFPFLQQLDKSARRLKGRLKGRLKCRLKGRLVGSCWLLAFGSTVLDEMQRRMSHFTLSSMNNIF